MVYYTTGNPPENHIPARINTKRPYVHQFLVWTTSTNIPELLKQDDLLKFSFLYCTSPMSSAAKLTKKQKKALAFRARHSKTSSDANGPEDNAFPIAEDQEIAEDEEPSPNKQEDKNTSTELRLGEGKKRKREQAKTVGTSSSEQQQPKSKKRKTVPAGEDGVNTPGEPEVLAKPTKKEKSSESKIDAKQRFILFVGTF